MMMGILVSLIVPLLAYIVTVASVKLSRLHEPQEDFQYHDSYFTVIHMDPVMFPVIAVTTFIMYVAISSVVRYVRRKE